VVTQLTFDLEVLEITRPDQPAAPARRLLTKEELDWLIAEALTGPDPASIRIPRPGDRIEMLWPKPPSRGWYRAVVTRPRGAAGFRHACPGPLPVPEGSLPVRQGGRVGHHLGRLCDQGGAGPVPQHRQGTALAVAGMTQEDRWAWLQLDGFTEEDPWSGQTIRLRRWEWRLFALV